MGKKLQEIKKENESLRAENEALKAGSSVPVSIHIYDYQLKVI